MPWETFSLYGGARFGTDSRVVWHDAVQQDHRERLRQIDERLKGTDIWLYREENLPDKH